MSMLSRYFQLEQEIKTIRKKMQDLEESPQFQKEKEFLDKLRELMNEYDKSPGEIITALAPDSSPEPSSSKARRKRKLKVYKNPETGEIVETRGGNQKTLKAWKEQYGSETVDSWLIEEK
jgi:predicted  nucleic acid-binding Zn-ribbon protein